MEQGQSLSHLPGERFELALDSQRGMLTNPSPGGNVVTITNQRAIRFSTEGGKHTTGSLSLDRLSGMEIIDVGRPSRRLGQGLLAIGAGAVLGALAWTLFSETLFVLILGGLPALAGVYLLSGYIFPDETGEFTLYAGSYTMRLPLLTADARRDAYLVADRITELSATEPSAASDVTPDVAEEPGGRDFAPEVNEVPYASVFSIPASDDPEVQDSDVPVLEAPIPAHEGPDFSVPATPEKTPPPDERPEYTPNDPAPP